MRPLPFVVASLPAIAIHSPSKPFGNNLLPNTDRIDLPHVPAQQGQARIRGALYHCLIRDIEKRKQ